MQAETTTNAPVVMHFKQLPAGKRFRHYLRVLRRPRMCGLLFFLVLLPTAFDRAVALLIPSPRWSPFLFGEGIALAIGAAVLLLVVSELTAAVHRLLGWHVGSMVFSDDGICETRGRREKRHGWDWVAEAWEADDVLIIACHEPLRSFRLGKTARRHILVEQRASAECLERLLEVHRPGLLRKNGAG